MSARFACLALVVALVAQLTAQEQPPRPSSQGRLFPPQDLGLLDSPDRHIWQLPDRVMDALGIADASVVADIGAGGGWFTVRLARRVGPNGVVYAQDIQPQMLASISRRVASEVLLNVRTVRGQPNDPKLPAAALHAALLVGAYYEIDDRVTMLRNVAKSLRAGGRLGVIDFTLEGGGPGPPTEERVQSEIVIQDAAKAGLRLLSQETFLPFQYFLIFGVDRAGVARD